jgi:hypothetical protein
MYFEMYDYSRLKERQLVVHPAVISPHTKFFPLD